MRVPSRGWALVLVSTLAAVLAPTAAAAADEVYLLAPAGDSGTPQYLTPLGQTAAGEVYRNDHTGRTWIDTTGLATVAQPEERLADPTVIGDLLSTYDPDTATLRWRTIADPTLHESVVPGELSFAVRTPTGYLATQGSGPYELVAVELLAGSSQTVIGSIDSADGILAGRAGAAVPNAGVPGEWSYFAYDGSGSGTSLRAPIDADECLLASTHLYCWSATALTRLPVTAEPGATVAASPVSLVETGSGVAYTVFDTRFGSAGWHQVWVWRTGEAAPVRARDGYDRLSADLAPVTGSTDVALAARRGSLSDAGIYRISSSFVLYPDRATRPVPRTAAAIALGPGRAVWSENGGLAARDLRARADGGLDLGTRSSMGGGDGTALSVSGWRVASAGSRLVLTGVPGDVQLPDAEVTESSLSGQRVVWQSRDADGGLGWQLTDLTTKTTEPLPDAVSYDLWGERLVRLDADGSVWLHDLRTAADPEQVSPAIAGGAQSGTVHIAGDVVAWDVTPADPEAPDPGVLLHDVTTPDPAEQVTGLSVLHDLSTGYAAGCSGGDGCSPVAVSLADGTVTPVESDRPLAVDGNLLGYITTEKLPAVRVLAPVDDQPRLLGAPGAPSTIDFARRTFSLRISASQPLTTCAVQIRDEQDVLVRSVPCSVTTYGAATAEWNGYGATFEHVPDGTYTWRIVAANGERALVDYDGSAAGLEGELVVDGPPDVVQVTPEPGDVAVRQDTGVTVRFDEPVSGASATTLRLHTASGADVAGAVSYDAGARAATFTPHAPLSPMSRYTLTIEDGIADLRGNPLAEPGWEEIAFSTGTTSTAVQCSLVLPSKVVVDSRVERMGFRVSSNCRANGADYAYWDLIHTGTGFGAPVQFESADLRYPDWWVDWADTAPMGAWTLRPGGAGQADGNPLKQNAAALKVKYASRLAVTVKRATGALTWTATATQWSGSRHGWNTRARVTVGLFHQAPGTTTWKYVKSTTTSSTGRATVSLGSPKSGSYRLTVAETPTVWASYSTPVRGR